MSDLFFICLFLKHEWGNTCTTTIAIMPWWKWSTCNPSQKPELILGLEMQFPFQNPHFFFKHVYLYSHARAQSSHHQHTHLMHICIHGQSFSEPLEVGVFLSTLLFHRNFTVHRRSSVQYDTEMKTTYISWLFFFGSIEFSRSEFAPSKQSHWSLSV